jgi:hypothetical protein
VLLRRPAFAQPLFIDSATSMMSRRSDFAKRIISAVPFAARKSHEQMRVPLGDYLLVRLCAAAGLSGGAPGLGSAVHLDQHLRPVLARGHDAPILDVEQRCEFAPGAKLVVHRVELVEEDEIAVAQRPQKRVEHGLVEM